MVYNFSMALAEQQDIPKREETKTEWSFRRLFPFAGAVSAVAKSFTSPFDVLLALIAAVIGTAELIGRDISWPFWVFAFALLVCSLAERHKPTTSDNKSE